MKRARDGCQEQHQQLQQHRYQHQYQQHQQQQDEHEIPPPPPPRNRSASSNRPPAATMSTVVLGTGGGGGGGGGAANVFSGSSASSSVGTPSPTLATSHAPKRAKLGLGQPEGWRAAADEILLKAGIREGGGKGAGAGSREGAEGSPKRGRDEVEIGEDRPTTTTKGATVAAKSKRRFAVVCAANFNRSMMAHELLQKQGFRVESYGTSRELRLPGKDITSPEVFPFGTPYRDLYDTLKRKDEAFFLKNNLLRLAARNATIKAAPQRFQDIEGFDMADFDVVLCFEARVFYSVVEDLQSRDPEIFKPLHIINMTIKDSFEESAAAAGHVLELCRTLDGLSQLEEEAPGVLEAFTRRSKRNVLHQICHV